MSLFRVDPVRAACQACLKHISLERAAMIENDPKAVPGSMRASSIVRHRNDDERHAEGVLSLISDLTKHGDGSNLISLEMEQYLVLKRYFPA